MPSYHIGADYGAGSPLSLLEGSMNRAEERDRLRIL
jgi:hypothetical protein